MVAGNGEIKERVLRLLCHHGVGVFLEDIIRPANLEMCGVRLPAKGKTLLKILIELAQERKLIIWKEDSTIGFLPASTWRREFSIIGSPLRIPLKSYCRVDVLRVKEIPSQQECLRLLFAMRCKRKALANNKPLVLPHRF